MRSHSSLAFFRVRLRLEHRVNVIDLNISVVYCDMVNQIVTSHERFAAEIACQFMFFVNQVRLGVVFKVKFRCTDFVTLFTCKLLANTMLQQLVLLQVTFLRVLLFTDMTGVRFQAIMCSHVRDQRTPTSEVFSAFLTRDHSSLLAFTYKQTSLTYRITFILRSRDMYME